MNEEKRAIKQIKEIEFKCKECNAKITLEINEKANMPTSCCNCGESYPFDPMENPLRHLMKSFDMFDSIKMLEVNLICDGIE